jgi:hypothetical protein
MTGPGTGTGTDAPTTSGSVPGPGGRGIRRIPAASWARLRAVWAQRRWRIVGAVLVLGGLFLAGFASGWSAHTLAGVPAAPDTTVQFVEAPSGYEAGEVVIPDVRGLAVADARQAVADAGIAVDRITVVEGPSALPAGTVTTQDPIGGSSGAGAVTLTVAVAGTMPELAGTPATAAAQTLLDLGVRAVQQQVYDPAVAEGTVLAVEPAAGSPLAPTATLTVAGPASSVFLAELDALESACSRGEISLNGQDHAHSLYCGAREREAVQVYLLDRQATLLTGVLGITDRSDPGASATVRILADGVTVFEGTATYGASAPFEARVAGALRVEIRFIATNEDADGEIGFGAVRAVGGPDGIDALAAE